MAEPTVSLTLNTENIAHRMVDKNIKTRTELAKRAGVPVSTLSRAMNGDRAPSTKVILSIMKALDMTFPDTIQAHAAVVTEAAA